MKIAYLFGSLNRGGTETLMLDVCRNLSPSDFEAIGIYRKSGVLEQNFLQSGVPFYKIETGKIKVAYLVRLRRVLQSNKIDIAHAMQPIDALYARLACVGLKIKVILTHHGFDYYASNHLMRYIIKYTDLNIYVSLYQQCYYVEKYHLNPEKQTVVYNGIDFNKITKVQNNPSLRTKLSISDKTLLLAMVGNFNVGRDQMTVCHFLNELNNQNLDFHFVFIGKKIENDPERYDRCVDYCQKHGLNNRVSFLGVRNDVPEILPQLDAFIYATEHDTFGIAVVEAMAAGIAVFVNDWPVMAEITEDGKLAIIYKTKDKNDLLGKFMLFLQHRDEYQQKALESAKIIKTKFGIKRHIMRLLQVYNNIRGN